MVGSARARARVCVRARERARACAYTRVRENDVFPCKARSLRDFCYLPTPKGGYEGTIIFVSVTERKNSKTRPVVVASRSSVAYIHVSVCWTGSYLFGKSFFDSTRISTRTHIAERATAATHGSPLREPAGLFAEILI